MGRRGQHSTYGGVYNKWLCQNWQSILHQEFIQIVFHYSSYSGNCIKWPFIGLQNKEENNLTFVFFLMIKGGSMLNLLLLVYLYWSTMVYAMTYLDQLSWRGVFELYLTCDNVYAIADL